MGSMVYVDLLENLWTLEHCVHCSFLTRSARVKGNTIVEHCGAASTSGIVSTQEQVINEFTGCIQPDGFIPQQITKYIFVNTRY